MNIDNLLPSKYTLNEINEMKKLVYIMKQNNEIVEQLKQNNLNYNNIIDIIKKNINNNNLLIERMKDETLENNKHLCNIIKQNI